MVLDCGCIGGPIVQLIMQLSVVVDVGIVVVEVVMGKRAYNCDNEVDFSIRLLF